MSNENYSELESYKKNMEKLTVSEFRTWLHGVMEFQDEGWTPNEKQWGRILEKIEQLDEVTTSYNNYRGKNEEIPVAKEEFKASEVSNRPEEVVAKKPEAPQKGPPQPENILFDESTVELPQEPVRRNTQNPVKKTDSPTITVEGDRKIVDTGEMHQRKPIDTSKSDYVSEFI